MSLYKRVSYNTRALVNNIIHIPKNILEFILSIGNFIIAVFEYCIYKLDVLVQVLLTSLHTNWILITSTKFKLTSKLIWSQGRLGSRIKYLMMLALTSVIFILGTEFQEKIVVSKNDSDFVFLNSDSVLVAKASASTQVGEIRIVDKPIEHTIEEGDTLAGLGKKYGISVESIKYANNLVGNDLKKGKILIIPPFSGLSHVVKKDETIELLARKYKVPTQVIVDFNYINSPYTLTEGETLYIPTGEIPTTERFYAGTPVYDVSAYGIIPSSRFEGGGTGTFVWPLSGVLTQFFSSYHPALDIANNTGNIVATDKGKVVRAGWWQGGYGNAVQIDHGNGYVTTYAHMSEISVSVDQEVSQGEKLGVVGSTGRSTGPHLHFTIQQDGRYINPLDVLKK